MKPRMSLESLHRLDLAVGAYKDLCVMYERQALLEAVAKAYDVPFSRLANATDLGD